MKNFCGISRCVNHTSFKFQTEIYPQSKVIRNFRGSFFSPARYIEGNRRADNLAEEARKMSEETDSRNQIKNGQHE